MRRIVFLTLLIALFAFYKVSAQNINESAHAENDTIIVETIIFTPSQASDYISNLLGIDSLWRTEGASMRHSLTRLVDHYHEPMDSVKKRLMSFDYDSIVIKPTFLSRSDTLPLRWLNKATFIVDTTALDKDPISTKETIVMNQVDSLIISFKYKDKIPSLDSLIDSLLASRDTIREVFIDSLYLESRNVKMHRVYTDSVVPPLLAPGRRKSVRFLPDSTGIVISEHFRMLVADTDSPFFIVPDEKMPDSLKYAVQSLFVHTEVRDSILLYLNDIDGQRIPFWLSTGESDQYRFWVRNQANDSITLWVGNPTKFDLSLVLEDDVSVERREKKPVDDIPITTIRPTRSLTALKPLKEIPVYWSYGLGSSFTMNQTYFSNWSRGGESSIAGLLDIRGTAEYTNKELKSKWTSSGRLRYGAIITEAQGFRSNTDEVEVNSQYNMVLRDKIDFSSVLYGKTQVAKGYNYPNDSVVVSKFLNPGTFTIGLGVEWKPIPKTSLNFSPLSYRNTFVLDTANINQSAFGIDNDMRARQEMGGQLVVRNSITILDGLNINNVIRLFSGYLDKPKNIDVDWEMSLDKQINWYSMIRLNLHIIYDDDIRFPVLDSAGNPVLLPDGSEKKAPRTQLKQFLGLTLAFRI
ncbi:MAG: DUF3078 domain-containing protein [Bacteroidales bacterium]|nr:DUF3078 domain-containing protein [Bacteroidales bacterium]